MKKMGLSPANRSAILLSFISTCWSLPGMGPYLHQVTQPVIHGEGPHWDSSRQLLYFVDISGESVYKYNPANGETTSTRIGKPVSLIVPIRNFSDKFFIGAGRDLSILFWDGENSQSQEKVLQSVEPDKPGNRFNDGKADARGVLWLGSIGYENASGVLPKEANLYHYSIKTCALEKVLTDVTVSNGIAWSLDNRLMYYIDTDTKKIEVFDFDITRSKISNRRTVFDFKLNNVPGFPDGMTIDSQGNLWVACYAGSRVIKIDPAKGRLLMSVILPAEKVTSVQFGGRNLDILYVTTSKRGLNASESLKQPLAGSVFAVTNLGATGLPANSAAECYLSSHYLENE